MGLSAKEAAETVGMTRQGIIKAIKTGKLSASKNSNGQWELEASELFRVYEAVDKNTGNELHQVQYGIQDGIQKNTLENIQKTTHLEAQNTILSERLKLIEEALEEARKDKDYLQNQLRSSMTLIKDMRSVEQKEQRKKWLGLF